MTVEVKTTIKFKSWRSPNFAIMETSEGKTEGPTIAVIELDADALEALARDWLEDLYCGTAFECPFRVIPQPVQ